MCLLVLLFIMFDILWLRRLRRLRRRLGLLLFIILRLLRVRILLMIRMFSVGRRRPVFLMCIRSRIRIIIRRLFFFVLLI